VVSHGEEAERTGNDSPHRGRTGRLARRSAHEPTTRHGAVKRARGRLAAPRCRSRPGPSVGPGLGSEPRFGKSLANRGGDVVAQSAVHRRRDPWVRMTQEPRDLVERERLERDAGCAVPEGRGGRRALSLQGSVRPQSRNAGRHGGAAPREFPVLVWKTRASGRTKASPRCDCRTRWTRAARASVGRRGTVSLLASVFVPGTR
jgi:hypothetical protein